MGTMVGPEHVPSLASHPRPGEHHFGKAAILWSLALIIPCAVVFGVPTAVAQTLEILLHEYLPFIVLLFALFVVAGGISVSGNLVGTPGHQYRILTFGTLSASLV